MAGRLKGAKVRRGGPSEWRDGRPGAITKPHDAPVLVDARGIGDAITIWTRIAWGQGESQVAIDIPPSDWRAILLTMMLADARALFDAYASLSAAMPDQIVRQATRGDA